MEERRGEEVILCGCKLLFRVCVCMCVHLVYAAKQAYGHVCIFTSLCLMGLGDVVLNMNTSTDCSPFLITALAC